VRQDAHASSSSNSRAAAVASEMNGIVHFSSSTVTGSNGNDVSLGAQNADAAKIVAEIRRLMEKNWMSSAVSHYGITIKYNCTYASSSLDPITALGCSKIFRRIGMLETRYRNAMKSGWMSVTAAPSLNARFLALHTPD
jgi:hypothetical protein